MAGVTLENYKSNDEGSEVSKVTVPSIGGTAQIVATAHLNDGGTPPSYPATPGVSLDGGAYPKGTAMADTTPTDPVN